MTFIRLAGAVAFLVAWVVAAVILVERKDQEVRARALVLLRTGPWRARDLRDRLDTEGVLRSWQCSRFYLIMSRLEDAALVAHEDHPGVINGHRVTVRVYRLVRP